MKLKIELEPGEEVTVTFAGTDGEIEVGFGCCEVYVEANMADSTGRVGTIYQELFHTPPEEGALG